MGNAPSSVPYGAQIAAINTSIQAMVFDARSPFVTYTSLTAPISAGTGQQISFSDITASIRLPREFNQTARDSLTRSTQFSANVTIVFDVTNASPSTLSISTSVQQSWPNDLIKFQADGRVLPPLGPVTLGDAGQVADLRIKYINGTLQYQASDGSPIITPIDLGALNQSAAYIVASVAITNSNDGPLAPASGFPGSFPPTPLGVKSVVANIPITCTEDIYNNNPNTNFRYTFSANSPASLKPNQPFVVSAINNYFTVPGDRVSTFTSLYGKGLYGLFVNTYKSDNDARPGIGLALDNVSPATLDISRQFIASDGSTPTPLNTGRYVDGGDSNTIIFALPNQGFLSTPSLTAGQAGTVFSVAFQDFYAYVSSYSARYGLAVQDHVTCTPNSATAFLRAPIVA